MIFFFSEKKDVSPVCNMFFFYLLEFIENPFYSYDFKQKLVKLIEVGKKNRILNYKPNVYNYMLVKKSSIPSYINILCSYLQHKYF